MDEFEIIVKGDRVRIESQQTIREGTVLTAYFDSSDGTYDIELASDYYGYVYWKQNVDGGTITKIQPGESLWDCITIK